MPDTGERSPTTHSGFSANGANAIDGNDSTNAFVFAFGTTPTVTVGGVAGDDLPAGATVNGVKLHVRASGLIGLFSYEAYSFTSVKLTLDGGSNYSSHIGTQNITGVTDLVFGGESETWGLDWSGFTDVSNLGVQLTTAPTDGAGNHFAIYFDLSRH